MHFNNYIRTACLTLAIMAAHHSTLHAQIGSHRNDFALGVGGGYVISNVGFMPKVTQDSHTGTMFGLSMRYTCEKYFSTICSIAAELNYTKVGWKERIMSVDDMPVVNAVTGLPEAYERNINYIQLPIFAHLAWGRQYKGVQFFFKAGPQFGLMLNESTKTNFNYADRNTTDRSNQTCAQDTMAVENKFDYGIAAGLGIEYSIPRVGHFLLEGRYYYGLGNIYGDTKRDYFAKSNLSNIVIRLTYLFDITRTKNIKKR